MNVRTAPRWWWWVASCSLALRLEGDEGCLRAVAAFDGTLCVSPFNAAGGFSVRDPRRRFAAVGTVLSALLALFRHAPRQPVRRCQRPGSCGGGPREPLWCGGIVAREEPTTRN